MNLEKVFDFIKERRGYDYPFVYKLVHNLPISDDELTVDGDLKLSDIKLEHLPDNLHVKGFLDLFDTDLPFLPKNLRVEDYVDLRKTRISVLPDNLYVGGSLDLDGLLIEELPNNLHVGRYLSIMVTPIGKKYSGDEIKKMIKDKGGSVNGRVYAA